MATKKKKKKRTKNQMKEHSLSLEQLEQKELQHT